MTGKIWTVESDATQKKRKWYFRPMGVMALLFLFCLMAVAVFVLVRSTEDGGIKQLKQRANERGEPFTLADIVESQPEVPENEDAFAVLLKLWKQEDPEYSNAILSGATPVSGKQSRSYNAHLPVLGSGSQEDELPWTDEQLEAARTFVQDNRDWLKNVSEALNRQQGYFPIAYQKYGGEAPMPHVPRLKEQAGILKLLALLAISENRIDDAIHRIQQVARTGELLKADYSSVAQMVRMACHKMAIKTGEELLSTRQLRIEQLQRLEKIISAIDPHQALRTGLIGERAYFHDFFEQKNPKSSRFGRQANSPMLQFVMGLQNHHQFGLSIYDEALETLIGGTPVDYLAINKIFNNAEQKGDRFPPKIFSDMFLPSMQTTSLKLGNMWALRQTALTALDIEEYRIQNNNVLPESLADLSGSKLPSYCIDPYADEPLKYSTNASGYRVYSAGPDQIDQSTGVGGTQTTGNNDDIAFQVEWKTIPDRSVDSR